jgi:hypothetical protein
VNALFGAFPTNTPNTLRGVWGVTLADGDASADLRFRFTDGKVIGGVKCTYKQRSEPIIVGAEQSIDTADLDNAKGQFVLATTLYFQTDEPNFTCDGSFDAATWNFQVTDKSVDMKPVGLRGEVRLTKFGD